MKKGFTLLELIFVIIVIGLLAKFGTNLLATAYTSAARTSINNRLQNDSDLTLQQLANRLQYRIKDSVVTRTGLNGVATSLTSSVGTPDVLEWVGYDIDGWLGINTVGYNRPTWSGFIDINRDPLGAIVPANNFLLSPGTNTTDANTVIQAMRGNGSATGFANSAIFFTGANSDATTDYGWNSAGALGVQSTVAAHRVTSVLANLNRLIPVGANFANTDIYENYKLSWTAYAIRLWDQDGDGQNELYLYYDYQPWQGERAGAGTQVLLLNNVDTFKFIAIGSSIKIQVCVNESNTLGGGVYALCKEIAIF